ncbi:unnamed protein product [Brassicogethes aeneus]|uniref:Protein TEX261 n=1 Tax=Brassicogethes aeneus TaxID=1431903 RepID=A0A9P0B309_BRAAE|nr:unnamed protein product [Brassicogethes aeneus]
MWFLTIVSYFAIIIQIFFTTIAIAAGLYYLAELVEEHTIVAKKCISSMNLVVTVLYVLLWLLESFPTSLIVCGLTAQIVHFIILKNFPFVVFLSPPFLAAVTLIIINHYLAFSHFGEFYYPFSEVIAYFTLFLWLVPFALFVSLSANDNVLPTLSERADVDVVSNYFSKKNKKYGLLTFFNYAKDSLLPVRSKKGF